MKRALFVDFEDSFSYNVIQELVNLSLHVDVVTWNEWQTLEDYDLLVLGPGPGHPDDYSVLFPALYKWLESGKKIFAVCLGHQILGRLMGLEVKRSAYPLHGQKVELELDAHWQEWLNLPRHIQVQRYNSLAVIAPDAVPKMPMLIQNSEIIMIHSPQIISYQFHPESMGTKCRQSFFRPILRDLL